MAKFVEFSNTGIKMPIVGYGMWQASSPDILENCLNVAFDAGYRHFDTAFAYENESVLGRVVKGWIESGKVKREELFIVTKLPIQGFNPNRIEKFLDLSLRNLNMDYVDLYLVHNPACLKTDENGVSILFEDGHVVHDLEFSIEEAWKGMEAVVRNGKAKSIGISNFSPEQVERVSKSASIKPANHQLELNVYYPQLPTRAADDKYGVTTCAYAPLGSPGRKESYKTTRKNNAHLRFKEANILEDPKIMSIGAKHGKTPAQVALRFLVQQKIVVIPKSTTPSRIKENIDIFDFELDENEMKELKGLDTGLEGTFGFDWSDPLPGLEKHPEFKVRIESA